MDDGKIKEIPVAFEGIDLGCLFKGIQIMVNDPEMSPHGISTRDVVDSLIRQKKNKRVKDSSLTTYENVTPCLSRDFPCSRKRGTDTGVSGTV